MRAEFESDQVYSNYPLEVSIENRRNGEIELSVTSGYDESAGGTITVGEAKELIKALQSVVDAA